MVAEIPHGSVVVTPTEMYHELRNMSDELKRLVAVVDPAIAEVRLDIAEQKASLHTTKTDVWAKLNELDRRLHGMNLRLAVVATAAAVAAGGAGGWLGSILTGG